MFRHFQYVPLFGIAGAVHACAMMTLLDGVSPWLAAGSIAAWPAAMVVGLVVSAVYNAIVLR